MFYCWYIKLYNLNKNILEQNRQNLNIKFTSTNTHIESGLPKIKHALIYCLDTI